MSSDHQPLHVILQRLDLAHQVAGLVRRDACRYNGPTHSARSSQRNLAGDVNVGHVLIFREQREVEEDCQRRRIWMTRSALVLGTTAFDRHAEESKG